MTPDYFALQVMNTILGGMFLARLNANIREEKGYSYGVSSFFGFGKGPNPFRTGGDIVGDKTDAALVEFMKELRGILGERPVTEEELKTRQGITRPAAAGTFASVGAINGALTGLWVQSLPTLLSAVHEINHGDHGRRRRARREEVHRSGSSGDRGGGDRKRSKRRSAQPKSHRSHTWISTAIGSTRLVDPDVIDAAAPPASLRSGCREAFPAAQGAPP
jgi:hypothetical protein